MFSTVLITIPIWEQNEPVWFLLYLKKGFAGRFITSKMLSYAHIAGTGRGSIKTPGGRRGSAKSRRAGLWSRINSLYNTELSMSSMGLVIGFMNQIEEL